MSGQVDPQSSLDIDEFYQLATCGTAADLDRALRLMPSGARLRDPRALALRGIRDILAGDVPGGIAVLSRAVDAAAPIDAQYFTELLVPYLISTAQLDTAEAALRRHDATVEELRPTYAALRAVLAARRGNDARSRAFAEDAVTNGRGLDREILVARILQRVALAATYRQEYQVAQQRALEAARAYERAGSHRHAGHAYLLLYGIAHSFLNDHAVAAVWAERMTSAGERSGDYSIANTGLIAQIEIAASIGDHRKVAKLRHRLQLNPLSQQFQEHFSDLIAQILTHLWAKRYEAAAALLDAIQHSDDTTRPQRALADALRILIDLSRWNVDEVRRRGHRVVSATVAPEEIELYFDARPRRLARVLAAASLIIVGDATRGTRALSSEFDPDNYFAAVTPDADLDEAAAPPLMRGFVRALNIARGQGVARAPIAGLTNAEMTVLRHLARGERNADIAGALDRSELTIKQHVRNILAKLNVTSRQKAVERARNLGILVEKPQQR